MAHELALTSCAAANVVEPGDTSQPWVPGGTGCPLCDGDPLCTSLRAIVEGLTRSSGRADKSEWIHQVHMHAYHRYTCTYSCAHTCVCTHISSSSSRGLVLLVDWENQFLELKEALGELAEHGGDAVLVGAARELLDGFGSELDVFVPGGLEELGADSRA